jgi:hypothetical protein
MHLFNGLIHGDIAAKNIHEYCSLNWSQLESFMIFFVKNVGVFHWILDVAVNPFCLLAIVSGGMEELHDRERQYLYGFQHMDPFQASGRDGTIPAVGAFKSGSPL